MTEVSGRVFEDYRVGAVLRHPFGRTIIALIENRQERDGSFTLPKILHSYGCPDRIGAQ